MSARTQVTAVLAGAVMGAALAGGALAGPVVDKATEIETQIAAGNIPDAMTAADALTATVWDANTTIGIHAAALVDAPVTMLGIYNPRADDKYQIGAPILIYAEPFGYGFASGGEGLYTFGFMVDLKVMTEAGEVLGELPSVANLDVTSRVQNREFPANLTYTLQGLSPGRYVLETTLRDKNSEKAGSFQNTIEIVEAPAAEQAAPEQAAPEQPAEPSEEKQE